MVCGTVLSTLATICALAWARSIVRVVLLPAIGRAWFIQQSSDIQALLLLLGLIIVAGFKKAIMLGVTSPLKSGLWVLLAGTLISLSLVSTGVKAEDLYFIHNDHLGTAQVITDKDQAVVWQGDYQPFGAVEETTAVVENPTRFPGQYFDQETGLHYNLMRDYDPVLGRYLQSDPVGLDGGINIYGYAYQNPIIYVDPHGETVVASRMQIGDWWLVFHVPNDECLLADPYLDDFKFLGVFEIDNSNCTFLCFFSDLEWQQLIMGVSI